MLNKIERCCDLLHKNLGTEVKWSGSFIRPMANFKNPDNDSFNTVDKHLEEETNDIISYFGEMHGWFPANPSKEDTVEALNVLYVEEKVNKYQSLITGKKIKGLYANEFDKESGQLTIDNIIDSHDFIFLAGLKGVGKTTFLNWWLNNYSEKLEDKKIIWFRVDASKLYSLWNDYSPEKCDLFRYYKVHLIYVVLKYSMHSTVYKQNETFKKIVDELNKSEDTKNYVKDIQGILSQMPDSEKQTEKFFYNIFSKSIACENIKLGQKTIIDCCEQLYDNIETYFQNNKLTMLFIIDGVDNIHWTKSKSKYNKLLNEIVKFFSASIEVPVNCNMKRLVTLRHETIADIDMLRPHDSQSSKNNKPFICEIRPPRIKSILSKKATVAEDPIGKKFKKKKDDLIKKISKDTNYIKSLKVVANVLSNYTIYSTNYIDSIRNTIKQRYQYVTNYILRNRLKMHLQLNPEDWNDPDEMLSTLFNSNVRACVDNFMENYKTITLARKQGVLGADKSQRLPIYLLTNGRLFLNTPHQTSRLRGNAYPNLFWWDETSTLNTPFAWHGLCTIRLLQFASKNNVITSTLKEVICTLFDYNKNVIDRSFDRCVQYGLFVITRSSNEKEDCDESNLSYIVSITNKGKFVLDYIFMYPDWLYISALDTPLDNKCVTNSKQISIHRDIELNFLDTYNAAFVITIPTFIRHILTQHDFELKNITDNAKKYLITNKKNEIKCFCDDNDVISTFAIPSHLFFIIEQSIWIFLKKLEKRDPDAFTDLYNIILGEYQKTEYRQ